MGYYERVYDLDGNPEELVYVKEEPDCPPCGDRGVVPARIPWRGRLLSCPSCRPTWWDLRAGRVRSWWWTLRYGRRLSDDEPPF